MPAFAAPYECQEKMMYKPAVAMVFACALVPLCGAVSRADAPAPSGAMSASMDCSQANTELMKMTAMPNAMPAMDAGASVDKNFAMVMHGMSEHAMKMAKIEATCGKDAKTRALAQKMVEDLQDYVTRLQQGERE